MGNLKIIYPKDERICFGQKESRRLTSAKWKKNGSATSIYVSDYNTAGEIIRVAYMFCFGAYVKFNTVNRFKLCQGCQVVLPVTSPTMRCWACAVGSFAENCGGEWHRWCRESDIAYYLPTRKWLGYIMRTIIRDHLYPCVMLACGNSRKIACLHWKNKINISSLLLAFWGRFWLCFIVVIIIIVVLDTFVFCIL